MKYVVVETFRVRDPKGERTIEPGKIVILSPEKAELLTRAGKVKPVVSKEQVFCYWKAGNVPVSECVMPCMTFKLGRTTSQCRYFAEHWASVVSKRMNKVSPQ